MCTQEAEGSRLDALACRDDGVGLAAPQVGVNVRLMVFNPTGKRKDPEYVLVNPKIVSSNAKLEVVEEGCLSFPKIFADVQVWMSMDEVLLCKTIFCLCVTNVPLVLPVLTVIWLFAETHSGEGKGTGSARS